MDNLQKKIDYKFNNEELLNTALRHCSVGKNSNERMEFLGDAILNFTIASELFNKYPKLREGELSRLRANLVKKETLAELAQEFGLGEHLFLGVGEKKSGGFRRPSILADAVEAIIGAIYLDSDIKSCQQKILQWYEKKLINLEVTAPKDAKTQLQELLQARKLPLPVYEVVKTEGQVHDQIFYVECRVEGIEAVTNGNGHSKQVAEQEAAQKLLEQLK